MFNATKDNDEIRRENIKNEKQTKELELEHDHLEIELYNIESIVSHQNNNDNIEQIQQTSIKMYQYNVELNNLMDKYKFSKILQCHHMEMLTRCHQEWQPLEEGFMKTIKWQEETEQRSIIQKYCQKEDELLEEKEEYQREKEYLRQIIDNIEEIIDKRNELIVNLIKASNKMENLKPQITKLQEYEKYIEVLKLEELEIRQKLKQMQLKTFKPQLQPYKTHKICTNSNEDYETTEIIIPELSSFMEILEIFNQNDKKTNITTIENTTEICIKSYLHNFNNNQAITTKQTKNKHFELENKGYEAVTKQAIYGEDVKDEHLEEIMEIKKDLEEIVNLNLLTQVENIGEIILKEFETFFEDNKEFLFASKDS